MRAVFAASIALLATGTAAAGTVTLGRGLPPWRLGRGFVLRAGLVHLERYRGNAGPGCVPGVGSATRIDYYRGLRVAWRSGVSGRLLTVPDTSRCQARAWHRGCTLESWP